MTRHERHERQSLVPGSKPIDTSPRHVAAHLRAPQETGLLASAVKAKSFWVRIADIAKNRRTVVSCAMDRIRAMVVDDEKPARMRLIERLQREPDVELAGTASDGREALDVLRRVKPDLLFLDVQMPQLDGFGVLQQLAPDELPITILVTAYDKYAIQAFDAHAIDYLLKPFSDQRFDDALKRARKYVASADVRAQGDELTAATEERRSVDAGFGFLERLVLKSNGCVTFLDVDQVDWIEAAGVYIYLHAGAQSHLYRSSVTQLLQRLNPRRFVRIHRSAAVNTSRIRELQSVSHGDFALILKDGYRADPEPGVPVTGRILAASADLSTRLTSVSHLPATFTGCYRVPPGRGTRMVAAKGGTAWHNRRFPCPGTMRYRIAIELPRPQPR
jgi:two-component system, LytTR family, response regulator